ncbi:aminoglycoside phosphotransferase family protein [Streptomyces lavendulae]|uniref:aminoglycoside phosphotransferase family protein n=1 Tax=Streptomyces lavendulae TaxID=1914 RepID=UPI0033C9E1C9
MGEDVRETVDRRDDPRGVTPWDRAPWRAAALAWAGSALAAHGLRETGERRVRLRPWSVLARISVEDGEPVWFKANPPASAFEAGLTEALSRWAPAHGLRPLAVDPARGWSLLPDGGPLFRDVLDAGPADPRAWEVPLARYAELQRDLTPRTAEIEALGVPAARTAGLPEVFDRLVAANTALDGDDRRALRALRPRLADWCAELADAGVADCLDHADLHEGQLFAPAPDRFTFFDWGDASVTHPFCGLLVPLRAARARYGPAVLPRLRDAYLEPWGGAGADAAALRRAASLALRLGAIGRAGSWARLFPEAPAAGAGSGAADSARWLRELLTEPLL